MSHIIDIFHKHASNAFPYISFEVDDDGLILNSHVHHQIAAVVEWCQVRALPVRAHDRQVRAALHNCGIKMLPALQIQVT
jgi:hypothetical protein